MTNGFRKSLWQIGPPVALFAVVIAAWHAATVVFEIKPYLLPGPVRVTNAIAGNVDQFRSALLVTAQGALSGFALSLVAGTLIGFAFSQSRIVRSSCYPYAIFLQTVPIVAIAPLIVIWFGYGLRSVAIVSFIVSLFPVITNATEGLTAVDPNLLDFFRLHNATRLQVLWKLRLPNAIPHLITAARTSSGLAVIGAIVGEFFVGGYSARRFGLGFLIRQTSDQLKTDELFASVIAATLLGVVVFAAVNVTGRWILRRWYDRLAT
jgi:NitT/TauT family transport system permease protein